MTRLQPGIRGLALLTLLLATSELSAIEYEERVLFDGSSLDEWRMADGSRPKRGWEIKDGLLHLDSSGGRVGDLYSVGLYENFELKFEWRTAPNGNSGVKYHIDWFGTRTAGFEYQILDDHGSPYAKDPTKRTGCLYALYPPSDPNLMRPLDQFNESRIVVRKGRIEHWLNGKKIVGAGMDSDDFRQRIEKSKFARLDGFAKNQRSPIQLQDHGSDVWFRKITIKRLDFEDFVLVEPGSVAAAATIAVAPNIDFDRDIRPILSDACFKCHGPDEKQRQAELRLDLEQHVFAKRDGNTVVVRKKPNESELIRRIVSDDPDQQMPPPAEQRQLTTREKTLLGQWIASGAEWSGHWSFQPVRRVVLPDRYYPGWSRNGIDDFIARKLRRAGLEPSDDADKETLIRRVTLDLTGLPPTLDEIDAFRKDWSDGDWDKVVDRLLGSERFGEHMAWHWLEAARYGDTNGYQGDRTRVMWFWREWVIDAFNRNLPYDQFVIEQLAGDLLKTPTQDQLIATGFNRNHPLNGEGGRIAEENRVEYVFDRTETTGTVFMGLTIGCARCHDHKFDPITQKDYYRFYAYYNNVDESGRVDAGGNANPVMRVATKEQSKRREDLEKQLAERQKALKEIATPTRKAEWAKSFLAEFESNPPKNAWEIIRPTSLKSAQGQTMTLQDDGAVLVTGKNPVNDNYRVELATDLANVTGIRLEALPHKEFTNKGLARSDSGNFVLTEFIISAESPGDAEAKPVKIASAQASFEQNGHAIATSFDGDRKNGWAVYNPPDMTIPRTAVFRFAKPIAGGKGTKLTVELQHESPHQHHNVGRFRLSLTTAAAPSLDAKPGVPKALVDALRLKPDQRNDAQRRLLSEEFRNRDAKVLAAQAQVNQTGKAIADLEKQFAQTMIMRDRKDPRETFMLEVGRYDKRLNDEKLNPGTPESLPPLPKNAPANRLAMARWLVQKDHPLTARVAVNRLWQHFFGTGLVKTAEDFGVQGERPSHPELLDWLASEYIRTGWDTKNLIRLIVTSSTYRQSSKTTPQLLEKDPYNRLLGRGPRYRLPAHVLRDQALALSGLLVERIGGPSVKPYQPPGLWADFSFGKIKYQPDSGDALYRRSLYTFWRRSLGPPNMFDEADRKLCSVRPSRTNTPLHALTLLNDITFVEAARIFAERIIAEKQKPDERLRHAFRLATARLPSERELTILRRSLDRSMQFYQGNQKAAAELMKVGQKPVAKGNQPVEVAAYASVMSVLLNSDEVMSKE